MAPKTIAEKILSEKSGQDARAGQIVFCRIDQMMAHDANGPLAVQAFRRLGGIRVHDAGRIHMIMDHAAPAPNERISNLHMFLREFAQEQGIDFIECGEGVCHQLMLERGYVSPGDLVIGTDSHTCTYGAAGAFATGVGATDMGAAFLTGASWFKVPETIRVELKGPLLYGDNISEKRGKGRDWRGQVWKRPDFRRVCGGTAPEQGRDVAVILRKTASAAVGAFFAPRKAPGDPTNGTAGNDAQTYESPQNGAGRPFLGACGIK